MERLHGDDKHSVQATVTTRSTNASGGLNSSDVAGVLHSKLTYECLRKYDESWTGNFWSINRCDKLIDIGVTMCNISF